MLFVSFFSVHAVISDTEIHRNISRMWKHWVGGKRGFSHAGTWLVSFETRQMPDRARVFIWDRGCVGPDFSGCSCLWAELRWARCHHRHLTCSSLQWGKNAIYQPVTTQLLVKYWLIQKIWKGVTGLSIYTGWFGFFSLNFCSVAFLIFVFRSQNWLYLEERLMC